MMIFFFSLPVGLFVCFLGFTVLTGIRSILMPLSLFCFLFLKCHCNYCIASNGDFWVFVCVGFVFFYVSFASVFYLLLSWG